MRRLIHVAASLTCAALVAGCGGAPEASTPPSPSPTPTPPESASSPAPGSDLARPEKPANVTKKNGEGARAASRFFLEALNYAGATGDTTPLRMSYTDFCTRCEALARGIEETYADGGRITGDGWLPQSDEFFGIKEDIAFVDVVVDVSPQTWTASEGADPVNSPGQTDVLKAFQLDWRRDEGWLVAALDPES